jgi:hypothetical protein
MKIRHRLNSSHLQLNTEKQKGETNMHIPIQFLNTITAKDLMAQPAKPLGFTIDGILPHGLFILAGSPKVGKSWLALDMCQAVSAGGSLWQYSAAQGDVLYLALEDTRIRLQERLNRVSYVRDSDSTTDIHFATKSLKLGDGLDRQLTDFIDWYPQTKLIIIDTMQYIRNNGKSVSTYSNDYRDMDALRAIIENRKLTLLLVTHTRKTGDADPLNLISGSTGLAGAVDGVFILEKNKRVGSAAKLTIANRDTESHQFELRFDKTSCRWQFIRETGDDNDTEDYLYELLNLLLDETPIWSGTATQLSATLTALDPAFTVSPIGLSRTLKSQQAFLLEQHKIDCRFTRNKTARIIELSRDVIVVDCENTKREPLGLVG